MNYRIESKESFRIIGASEPLHKEIEQNFHVVPEMWQKAAADGTIAALAQMMDQEPMGLLGVSACHDDEEWRYYLAVSSSRELTGNIEVYQNADPDNAKFEVWIPVTRKE